MRLKSPITVRSAGRQSRDGLWARAGTAATPASTAARRMRIAAQMV